MHQKAVFALAGVFLIVALVVPTVVLILQTQTLQEIVIQNIPGHETRYNVTTTEQILGTVNSVYAIVVAVETVFIVLFAITIYYGINHVHPTHTRPER